jgi:hypothetical protein
MELARLKNYDAKLQADMQGYLQNNSYGTFIWVALVCKQLADPKARRRKTLSVLESFSPGLYPFYPRWIKLTSPFPSSATGVSLTFPSHIESR